MQFTKILILMAIFAVECVVLARDDSDRDPDPRRELPEPCVSDADCGDGTCCPSNFGHGIGICC
ncbi:hypothetical protein BCV70DRAFT_202735 [Testicularia cyperi]|uniref:Uncharacterized protein n=1 Tax=Testicularia cyperi TaxID=1882483 RepID=A0A317XJV1_9BASI|nr:hypothetical protein BCV70DRAFT_202735 [Testicularia cyperi]